MLIMTKCHPIVLYDNFTSAPALSSIADVFSPADCPRISDPPGGRAL